MGVSGDMLRDMFSSRSLMIYRETNLYLSPVPTVPYSLFPIPFS